MPAGRTNPQMDEESSLLSAGRAGRPLRRTRAEKGVTCNRYLILILLVALVLLSVRFQQEVNSLTAELESSQKAINDIKSTLIFHEEVIERFNSSVTNADVIAQLGALENSLNQTSVYLQDQLQQVQVKVSTQLENTVKELSETVTQAKQEISDEVEKVKKDVEHYVITTQDQFSMENSFMVYQLAGTFTLLSCLISMWHMTAHLRKMNQPDVQRKILAILWMSPIYAVTSWFSLVFHSAEGYLAIIKDGYEAYIIYQFLSFCISVIGRGDRKVVVDVLARHADHLTPPFRLFGCFEMCGCCVPDPYPDNRALADAILLQCQSFAMQFVFFRPVTTTAMVVLKNLAYYGAGNGPTDYRSPQFYITIIQNLSIFTAFTGLLKFYHAVDSELSWCRPLAKFLCIKGVVFMTFWQGLCISILAQTTDVAGSDKEEWATSAQNFLICLEMLLFSIAHFYCFPTDEWQEGYRIKHQGGKFGDTIALGDFFSDVKLILTSGASTTDKAKRRRQKSRSGISSKSLKALSEDEIVAEQPAVYVHHAKREGTIYDIEQPGGPDVLEVVGHEDEGSDETASGEDDDDNDDTESTSQEDLDDDEQFIKKALRRSLGIAGDDPDIIEATKRLLDSKVLSPEFFKGNDDEMNIPPSFYGAFHESAPPTANEEDHDEEDFSDEDDEDHDGNIYENVGARNDDEEKRAQALDSNKNQSLGIAAIDEDEKAGQPLDSNKKQSLGKTTVDKDAKTGTPRSTDGDLSPKKDTKSQNEEIERHPSILPSGGLQRIEEDVSLIHTHESKTTLDEDSEHSGQTPPQRAYQQKGLEFLTPERQGSEDLRPSIFTTISQIDKKVKDDRAARKVKKEND